MMLVFLVLAADLSAAKTTFAHEYRRGRIRIFYDSEGLHAVDQTDVNRNGVPDRIEDLATQTWAAYTLFVDTLGFPDPFQTERFRGAAFLDIHLRDKSVLGHNGVAYDELQRFHRKQDPRNTTSLCFNVATSVDPSTSGTPAHELFHLIQSSVSHFKNDWYTEGTARWSERALGTGGIGPVRHHGPWPLPDEAREALFALSYEASERFWNPLAVLDDPRGTIPEDLVKPELRQLTYCSGAKVLKDLRLTGWELIREVLLELGKQDPVAFRELGYRNWSEANQSSPRNHRYIYEAVAEVVRRRGHPWPIPAEGEGWPASP
jgi:hypothetical protein